MHRRAIGRVLGEIFLEVKVPLYRVHPELQPSGLDGREASDGWGLTIHGSAVLGGGGAHNKKSMAITRRVACAGGLAAACIGRAQTNPWIAMFDGKSLRGWKDVPFSGRGEVRVENGTIRLGKGRMTGIAWAGEFPKVNYEIRFEAARLDGKDFFASPVFPVNDSYCSWINGGWDGTVVGLSNLDGNDASENDTSTIRDFHHGRWYSFRLAVTESRIRAFIDESAVIDVDYSGRDVALRFDDSDLCAPLGFMSYATTGGIRKIDYRLLDSTQ